MSVLCISDISWEEPDRDTLKTIKNEIENVSPSLVLFGGDVINDGFNSTEHVDEFVDLLNHLEKSGITSATIEGNHDEYSNYGEVVAYIETLDYANEISGEVLEFDGLTILGLSYSHTHSLRTARDLSNEFPEQYDIVLAHAERSRRIWLFELDAQYIITGHFANRLCQIRDQVFVSMGTYPRDSVLLEPAIGEVVYRRRPDSPLANQERYDSKAWLENGEMVWEFDEHDPDIHLRRMSDDSDRPDQIERLLSAKERIAEIEDTTEERVIVDDLLEAGIPKTHIREYIARYDFL